MVKNCTHLKKVDLKIKPNTEGCEECLKMGDTWVSLRKCLTCGHVGCCNSSKNKHAQKHFNSTKHLVIEEFPDANWRWCYIDNDYVWFNETKIIRDLEVIPWVGPSIAKDLFEIGVYSPKQMAFMDPEKLYEDLQAIHGPTDPCVLYTFRSAKYWASTKNPDPKLIHWKNWKDRVI